ncbi:IMP dehydrogenase [archaeon]|jgi:IMP dehydrogenase|nr:IMP dehydrogenase [archaeon]MBT6761934.1 IMP dehydrogenase [archaeon]
MENLRIGLTYSDVLLVPKKTPLKSRSEANVTSKFSRNVKLNLPIVASNMVSVCESKMAIALARVGAIGVIHQFNKIKDQAEEVTKVKRSTCYVIDHPLCITAGSTIEAAVKVMEEKNVTSLLVTTTGDGHGELQGIFTSRDYLFEENRERLVREVMTNKENLIVANPSISSNEAKQLLHTNRIEKLPLLDERGKISGLITTKDIRKLEQWNNANRDSKGRLVVAAAVGVKDALERAGALVEAGVDVLVLDIAHCHSDYAIQRIRELKQAFPHIDVVAGNIATKEAARDLIAAGADGLKVGIGPSPVCTTRIMSGSGVPQLTAVFDVCQIAKQHGVPVCADGGITYPGDVAKALAAGASSIMTGSKFAGCKESPGMIFTKDGRRYKRYMGSASYQNNHEKAEKMKGKHIKEKLNIHVEGVPILVDYKGPAAGVVESLIKGLRSGISYCGARDIQSMQANAEFMQITSAGWHESGSRGNKMSD